MEQRKLASFEWSLRWPSGMLPLRPDEPLCSPRFYADDSRTTEFYLGIERGDFVSSEFNFIAGLFLCRCDTVGPNIVEIEYELDIKPNDTGRKFKQKFVKHSSDDLYDYNKENVQEICRDISMDKWIIVCRILSYDDGKSVTSEYADRDDMEDLSSDFAKMLKKASFSDGVIRSSKKAFKIHKAILEVRCPELLKKKQVSNLLGEYSQHTIQMILHYLYSGKFNSDDIPDELYNLVLKSDDLHLRHLIASFSAHTHAETSFFRKYIHFIWKIHDFLKLSRDNECIYTVTEDICPWFKFSFFLKQESNLEFVIESLSGTVNVFVRCLVTVIFSEERSEIILNSCHYFHNEDIWKISMDPLLNLIKDSKPVGDASRGTDLKEVLNLSIKFKIYDGRRTTSVKYSNIQSSSNFWHLKALHGLGQDMKKLLDNSLYSDVSLKVKEKTFRVHKAILSSRSSVFRRMFRQKELLREQTHAIEDLEEEIASSMISYIYSAQINDIDVDLAIGLYKAADEYKVLKLKEKCVKFLKLSLNATNIAQIESFANEQYDMDLQKSVSDFKSEFQLNH